MPVTDPDSVEVLSDLLPLGTLSEQSQARVMGHSEVIAVRSGEVLFNEGDSDPYAYWLLEGRLELSAAGQTVQRVSGHTDAAAHALAQLQPRKMTARAECDATVLRVERDLLDKLSKLDDTQSYCTVEVAEIETDDTDDWMTRMLQSPLFSALPAANIQRIFALFEPVNVDKDAFVVEQDEAGDYYYILVAGRAEIIRAAAPGAPAYRLALIGPGDAFGEEALVGGGTRNASVRMLSDGELVRLDKDAFAELIKTPLLSAVTLEEAESLAAASGAEWLDVRFKERHAEFTIHESINHPLSTLRMHSARLARDATYIVFCDDGAESAIAAFLLGERGFSVHFLQGGLSAYGLLDDFGPDAAAPELEPVAEAAPDLTLSDDETSEPDLVAATAPIPASHLAASERGEDPAAAPETLKAQLAINELRVDAAANTVAAAPDDAAPAPGDASAAPHAAETAPGPDAAAELERAREAARAQARADAERELARERARAEEQLADFKRRSERQAVARIREERRKAELAQEKARREVENAKRVQESLKKAQEEAEEKAAAERAARDEAVGHAHAELERRVREEEERLRSSYRWQAEELERLKEQKSAAEDRLADEQRRVREEAERAEAGLAEARAVQERLKQVERESAEKENLRQREKLALKRRLREELDEKIRSERAQLEQQLARNANELVRARRERAAAEKAREAAAEEAQKLVDEVKLAHARKRMQHEAEMRAERERLETEAGRLRTALELAQKEKLAALENQHRIESEISALRDAAEAAPTNTEELERLEAEADAAAKAVEEVEQERVSAAAAAEASADELAQHAEHERESRSAFEHELDDWLKEQAELENSDAQRELLANQRAHLERIKQRAVAAREAAREHDQSLIDEIASQLDKPPPSL